MTDHLANFIWPIIVSLVGTIVGIGVTALKQIQRNATQMSDLNARINALEGDLSKHDDHGEKIAEIKAFGKAKKETVDNIRDDIRRIFEAIGALQQDVAVLKREVLNDHSR